MGNSKIALAVRDLQPADIPLVNRYWAETTDADLARMGEIARPDERACTEFLEWLCATRPAPREAEEGILIWTVDSRPVGFSTLKQIRFGNDAEIHLHLWEIASRGKGLGAALFCLGAEAFRKAFQLTALYCQPKADNPMPNRALQKIGYPRIGPAERVHPNGVRVPLNRYSIESAVSLRYLRSVADRFAFAAPG